MTNRRVILGRMAAGAAVTASAAGIAAAWFWRNPSGPVRIGIAQPLSGPLAPLGQDLQRGAQMAIDDLNAAGGVHINGKGLPLVLVSADDRADAESGKAAARALVAADVVAAIAHLNSGVSIAAAPIYAAAGIPQLAISTKPEYTRLGLPTTLRLVANDELQSRAIGSFAAQLPGIERYAVVDDGTPYGRGLADAAAKVLAELGNTIQLRISLDDQRTDFEPQIAQFQASKIDLLVSTLNDFQVDALMTQAARAGMTRLSIVGGDTLKTALLPQKDNPIRAVYATSAIVEPREFEGGKTFVGKFRKLYQADPVYGAHYAYDAVYLIAGALSRNASLDKGDLLSTLKSFDGNCPMTNSMRFGPDGEQRYGAVAVYQLRNGAWDPLMRSDRW